MDKPANLTAMIESGASAFAAADWQALAGADRQSPDYNPFVSHEFLTALEASGSVGGRTGWAPQYIALRDDGGRLVGAMPSYLKSHSQGEYVFDHGWADALERAGGQYYPKLQVSVPFTPATGPRLLVNRTIADQGAIKSGLANVLSDLTVRNGLSSAHVTFADDADMAALRAAGYLVRHDQQFHFINRGYRDFQDFLDSLASRKRKTLRKEREAALANGIEITLHTGSDITEDVLDAFFACYITTGSRKWGSPYLTRAFFSRVAETMADDILLVMARRGGAMIAGAINFMGDGVLFGRNWGCLEHHPFLHFEVCYYQAIDYALAKGFSRVEAGAQGEHKLARGYEPATTRSAHFIGHPGLRDAVARYLERERADVETVSGYLMRHTPFRKSGTDASPETEDD